MSETRHYSAICPTALILPERQGFFELGFGSFSSMLPISHIQDAEELNSATYLDFCIDKWRIDTRWRRQQQIAPMIRVEFLRGKQFAEFVESIPNVTSVSSLEPPSFWAITLELDGDDIHRLDYVTLKCLVCGVIELGATRVVEDKNKEVSTATFVEEAENLRSTLVGLKL